MWPHPSLVQQSLKPWYPLLASFQLLVCVFHVPRCFYCLRLVYYAKQCAGLCTRIPSNGGIASEKVHFWVNLFTKYIHHLCIISTCIFLKAKSSQRRGLFDVTPTWHCFCSLLQRNKSARLQVTRDSQTLEDAAIGRGCKGSLQFICSCSSFTMRNASLRTFPAFICSC